MINRREMMAAMGSLLAGAFPAATALAELTRRGGTLKEIARKRGLIVGASAGTQYLQDPAFASFLAANFDMITPGNDLKFGGVHPQQTVYNFTKADAVFKFAQTNGMRVHGHNLCWNILNPPWVQGAVTKDTARDILEDHIKTVAGRYKGRVDSWDVVNEPIRINAKRPDGLSTGPWLDNLGPEYLDIAFDATKAADPSALRVLNLDNVEQANQVGDAARKASIDLLRDLMKRGVPVQAVGFESHLQANLPIQNEGRTTLIKQIKDLGLEVLLTELDIDDTNVLGPDDVRRAAVGKAYYDYLKDTLPLTHAKRVIFWSFTDKDNWYDWGAKRAWWLKRADGAGHFTGLITADAKPTPALDAVKAALS